LLRPTCLNTSEDFEETERLAAHTDLVVVLQGISLACKQGQHTRSSVYSSASRCQMLASVEAEAAACHPDEVTFELPPPENDSCPKVW
jgi:hypothetical protein